MANNHQFSEKLVSELSDQQENSISQELEDSELETIAGGIQIITVSGPAPSYLKPRISTQLYNYLKSFGQ